MAKSSDCAAALLPQITIENYSSASESAWLRLVNQSSFVIFQKRVNTAVGTGGSAGLPIDGIPVKFTGFFNADNSYETFDASRNEYFRQEGSTYSESSTVAIFRQSLTDKQLGYWVECMTHDHIGVSLILSNDSEDGVTADIKYVGESGATLDCNVSITFGTFGGETEFRENLTEGRDYSFYISRNRPTDDIIVIVNSRVGAADAISIWPLPIVRKITASINANAYSYTDALNLTDDRDQDKDSFFYRGFVRAIDPNLPSWMYCTLQHWPDGIPRANLYMNFSSTRHRQIRVAVVPNIETARITQPTLPVIISGSNAPEGPGNRQNVLLGEFDVRAGINYVIVAADRGQWSLINGFWLEVLQ